MTGSNRKNLARLLLISLYLVLSHGRTLDDEMFEQMTLSQETMPLARGTAMQQSLIKPRLHRDYRSEIHPIVG